MSEIYNNGHDAHFRFGELIVYDAPLDVVNRNRQLQTLKQKWGIGTSTVVQVLFSADFDNEASSWRGIALQSERDGEGTGAIQTQVYMGNPAAWSLITSNVCHGGKGTDDWSY